MLVPALVETSNLDGLPTGLPQIETENLATENLAIQMQVIGRVVVPSSIPIFDRILGALEASIVVQDHLLTLPSC